VIFLGGVLKDAVVGLMYLVIILNELCKTTKDINQLSIARFETGAFGMK
jgi:hypothetical protein